MLRVIVKAFRRPPAVRPTGTAASQGFRTAHGFETGCRACDVPHRYATRCWPKALGNRLYESLSGTFGITPAPMATRMESPIASAPGSLASLRNDARAGPAGLAPRGLQIGSEPDRKRGGARFRPGAPAHRAALPSSRPLVPIGRTATDHWPIGRIATNHWSVASAVRESVLGRKAPRPLRSHADARSEATHRRAAGNTRCQVVVFGILYTTVTAHRAILRRHGYAAKRARSNV